MSLDCTLRRNIALGIGIDNVQNQTIRILECISDKCKRTVGLYLNTVPFEIRRNTDRLKGDSLII